MAETVPHQNLLDATELAFWGVEFEPFGTDQEVALMWGFPNLRRLKAGYDPAAGCSVEVVELKNPDELRSVVDNHQLAVVWDNEESIIIDLRTGEPITEPNLDDAEKEHRRQKVIQGLQAIM